VDFLKTSSTGRIVVVDRADYSVKVFDSEGDFVHSLGGRGRGMGHFEHLADAAFIDDSLVVAADDGRFRLIFFDFRGNLLREEPLDLRPIGGLGSLDGFIVLAGLGPLSPPTRTSVDSLYSVHFFSWSGEIVERALRMPPVFAARPEVAVRRVPLLDVSNHPGKAGTVFVTWRLDDDLVEIDVDGNILRLGHVPENEHFVSVEQVVDTLPMRLLRNLLLHTSPIVRLIVSNDLVVVAYFASFKGERQLRYNVYDRSLNLIVGDASGPALYTARGDTLIGLREAPEAATRQLQMMYLLPCPSLTAATK
jgi:hypothetical protein